MTGRERTMPVIEAVWAKDRWAIALPGNIRKTATSERGVRLIIAREASGSAIRFVKPEDAYEPIPAPASADRCWPHPCAAYHDTYFHTSGEDPCRCPCHEVKP